MNTDARAVRARRQATAHAEATQVPTAKTAAEREDAAKLESMTQERTAWHRADQEARRVIAAEAELVADLDALYLDRAALDRLQSPPSLIPAVLPRHAYGVLRGRDQTFKSFVALDWSLSLTTGRLWDGKPVERARVLYIAGEGAWGLRDRVAAWEQHHGTQVDPDWFKIRQGGLNLHRPGPAFEHLLAHVEDGAYGLVVVDTLRRVSGAADANSSEMAAVVDNLDKLKQATSDGSVLVVAHTDKGDNDSRGYSGIEDDADFVWATKRDGDAVDLALTKMKDGPDGYSIRLGAHPVGASLVLVPSVARAEADKATESEAKLLATLLSVFPDGAYSGQLQDAAGLPRTSYHRALGALKAARKVVNSGSQRRPFYEVSGLTLSQQVPQPETRSDLHRSRQVPLRSHGVPLVPRPLGSGTTEPGTLKQGGGEPRNPEDPPAPATATTPLDQAPSEQQVVIARVITQGAQTTEAAELPDPA